MDICYHLLSGHYYGFIFHHLLHCHLLPFIMNFLNGNQWIFATICYLAIITVLFFTIYYIAIYYPLS